MILGEEEHSTEEWKPITGFSMYEVSDLARVRSIDHEITYKSSWRGTKVTRIKEGQIIKTSIEKEGWYPKVTITNDEGKPKSCRVHRLLAIAFIPNPENKPFVNHIDGVKTNNALSNLEWVTRKENHRHAAVTGLIAKGDRLPHTKLKESEVLTIKEMLKEKIRHKDIAEKFNVCRATISQISGGKNWKHLLMVFAFLLPALLSGQSWELASSRPYVVTQLRYDQQGREYVSKQQGELLRDGDTLRVFPVMFQNECGLVGFNFAPNGFFLHISGQDSVQRVIRFDSFWNELDTLLEVPYKNPFSNRHRGGDLFLADSILYCSFGYGAWAPDAQNLDDMRGKLVKININTLNVDIVAHGLRNAFRFSFNPELNEGFVTDVGADIAEEVNYFTGDYSLLNMGWPCYENDSLLLDPDTLCNGYSYSFPEYQYSQPQPRAIIGGVFHNGNFYFGDHFSGFGGYIDSNWVFHELSIPFPANVTSMAVNHVTSTLRVSTWGGNIYELQELPLGIDEDTVDEDIIYPCRTCYNLYIDILGRRWDTPPIGIVFWAVRNSIVQDKLQYIFPD